MRSYSAIFSYHIHPSAPFIKGSRKIPILSRTRSCPIYRAVALVGAGLKTARPALPRKAVREPQSPNPNPFPAGKGQGTGLLISIILSPPRPPVQLIYHPVNLRPA